MIVGIGIAVFADHVLAVWRAENMNVALERRIAEKTREITADRARVEEATRELALAAERRLIVNDLHNRLGASLVGLLRHIQTGTFSPASVEQRAQAALQELRIAVDALQPSGRDIASILGNLRYRLDDMIRAAGVKLEWAVDELPPSGEVKPSTVFALQRIIVEAITNALKHSNARLIRLTARARGTDSVEIRIADDGQGVGPSGAGTGIANMHARALAIGAEVVISSTGQGTEVSITLPLAPGLSTRSDLSSVNGRAAA
jgi:signal transduction histidine kinase